jgi:hypothetical protein
MFQTDYDIPSILLDSIDKPFITSIILWLSNECSTYQEFFIDAGICAALIRRLRNINAEAVVELQLIINLIVLYHKCFDKRVLWDELSRVFLLYEPRYSELIDMITCLTEMFGFFEFKHAYFDYYFLNSIKEFPGKLDFQLRCSNNLTENMTRIQEMIAALKQSKEFKTNLDYKLLTKVEHPKFINTSIPTIMKYIEENKASSNNEREINSILISYVEENSLRNPQILFSFVNLSVNADSITFCIKFIETVLLVKKKLNIKSLCMAQLEKLLKHENNEIKTLACKCKEKIIKNIEQGVIRSTDILFTEKTYSKLPPIKSFNK